MLVVLIHETPEAAAVGGETLHGRRYSGWWKEDVEGVTAFCGELWCIVMIMIAFTVIYQFPLFLPLLTFFLTFIPLSLPFSIPLLTLFFLLTYSPHSITHIQYSPTHLTHPTHPTQPPLPAAILPRPDLPDNSVAHDPVAPVIQETSQTVRRFAVVESVGSEVCHKPVVQVVPEHVGVGDLWVRKEVVSRGHR